MPTDRSALLAQTGRALGAAEMFLAAGRARLVVRVAPEGDVEAERFATEQLAAHALAWMASYVEALRQMRLWAELADLMALGEKYTIDRLVCVDLFPHTDHVETVAWLTRK